MKAGYKISINEVRTLQNIGPQAALRSKQIIGFTNYTLTNDGHVTHFTFGIAILAQGIS